MRSKWYFVLNLGLVFFQICFLVSLAIAQKANVSFEFTLNSKPLSLHTTSYANVLKDSVQLSDLRFYISEMRIYKDDSIVDYFPSMHQLIDAEIPQTQQINFSSDRKFNHVEFVLGVDSVTSISGVFSGDLDPANGMYWTWQSGYIHFKLQGYSTKCPTRNHFFQNHIGGYAAPFNTLRKISLKFESTRHCVIQLPIDEVLASMDVLNAYEVMSPSSKAVEISHILAKSFFVAK